jgi:hypothetical protein
MLGTLDLDMSSRTRFQRDDNKNSYDNKQPAFYGMVHEKTCALLWAIVQERYDP